MDHALQKHFLPPVWSTRYLRVEPEDHVFVVAEPALVLPEAREQMAEVRDSA